MGHIVTDETSRALAEEATRVAFYALVIEVVRVPFVPSIYGFPTVATGISNADGHRRTSTVHFPLAVGSPYLSEEEQAIRLASFTNSFQSKYNIKFRGCRIYREL